jgi:hypothetical protein
MNPTCPKCGSLMHRGARTPSGALRWKCGGSPGGRPYCYSTTTPEAAARKRSTKMPIFKRDLGKVERFVVTYAQNATPIHKGFLDSLEYFCHVNSAELLVVPGRYRNPTSRWSKLAKLHDVWDDRVTPFLFNSRRKMNRNLVVLGDVRVQPTATSPLTGFEALTHGESGILPHPKLQLTTVPTPQSRLPKILTTTGACTVRNYVDSKAGKLGDFHHTLGAAYVEMRAGKFHLRQLNAEKTTGHFYDLDKLYAPGSASASEVEAIALGDMHVGFADPGVLAATREIMAVLRPKRRFYHDLLDGYSANPHHLGNPFNRIAKRMSSLDDVEREVHSAIEFVRDEALPFCEDHIVSSNHDDFLRRWIVSNDWRTDPVNAAFYLRTALAMVQATRMGPGGTEYPSPFALIARSRLPGVKVLDGDESCQVAGIELGMHGDRGPNGARGSRKNLRRIGVKSIIGHSHSPGIEEGCYQTGTSTRLRLEYTGGPSSWLNTHCIVYPNGKRSLINIIDGEWRL